MPGDLTIFEPVTAISPEEVKKTVSVFFFATVVASLIGIYLFRKYGDFSVSVGVIGVGCLLTGCLKRFPTRISINTRLKLLKADYLDAFGRERSMYLDLTKTNLSLKSDSGSSGQASVLRLTQNIFNTNIRIDRVSHFSEVQLDAIYSLVKSLKESGKV